MQAIFPESVDGDLLKLVHLSNGFKVLISACPFPFRVGDKCRSAAKILAVTNNDSVKTVTVTGHVLHNGKPLIEVRSSFLYRHHWLYKVLKDFKHISKKYLQISCG